MYPYQINPQIPIMDMRRENEYYEPVAFPYIADMQVPAPYTCIPQEEVYYDQPENFPNDINNNYQLFPPNQPPVPPLQTFNHTPPSFSPSYSPSGVYRSFSNPNPIVTHLPNGSPIPILDQDMNSPNRSASNSITSLNSGNNNNNSNNNNNNNKNYEAAAFPGPPIYYSSLKEGPAGCNLFIFHLPNSMTNLELEKLFQPYGDLISITIVADKVTGRSKGYGFVSYQDRASADKAIQSLNGYQIGKKRLKVQIKKGDFESE